MDGLQWAQLLQDHSGDKGDLTNVKCQISYVKFCSVICFRTRISTTTNPDDPSQYMVTMTIMEEPSDGDPEKITH